MKLVILTAVLAVCGAARRDRSYVPPLSLRTADGSSGALTPLEGSSRDIVPSGGYTNDALGVVVDAAAPGTRTSGAEPTGLGGPRTSYGSTDSKVGDAAFRATLSGFGSSGGANTRIAPGFGAITGEHEKTGESSTRIAPGFNSILPLGSENDKAHANTVKFTHNIGLDKYSFGYETDNGIAVGENGVAGDGINTNGGYSYKGTDGKVYSVSYTADKNGYKPQGSHLPTPPPIPDEILISLEKNAKEEAAGVVDDGSYDAQKYNNEGDYTSNNAYNNNNGPSASSASTGGSFVSHSNQANTYNPATSTGNSAYSSAVTTGFGSASAYAGAGQKEYALGSKFGSNSFTGASQHSNFGVANPSPTLNTASASTFGLNAVAEAVSTSSPTLGSEVLPSTQSTFGSSTYTQNTQTTGEIDAKLPQVNVVESSGSSINTFGNSGSSVTVPSSATASASFSGKEPNFGISSFPSRFGQNQNTFGQSSGANVQSQTHSESFNSLGSAGSSLPIPATELSTPFESSVSPSSEKPSVPALNSFDASSNTNPSPIQSSHQTSQTGTVFQSQTGQYKPQTSKTSFGQTGYYNAFNSKPSQSQQSGSSFYSYNQPQKPFVTPISEYHVDKHSSNQAIGSLTFGSSGQTFYNRQPNVPVGALSKQGYSNSPVVTTVFPIVSTPSGQYQNTAAPSLTQASVSPFPSKLPTTSTQYQSQSSNIGQYGTSGNQQSVIQFGQKPIVQSQLGYGQTGNYQSQSQQGTIYEYNKPTYYKETTSISKQEKSNQTPFASNTFGSTGAQNSAFQQTQTLGAAFGSQSTTQSGEKGTGSTSFSHTQFGEKPIVSSQTDSTFQQSQSGSQGTQVEQSSGTGSSQLVLQQNQGTIYEYNKPESALVHTDSNSQSVSQQNQGTIYEYNKPVNTLSHTVTNSASSGSQSSQVTSVQSGTQPQNSLVSTLGQQPSGALPTSIPTRFGETPSKGFGSTSDNSPQVQTSQFGQKASSGSQTGSNFQQSQFGSSFGQKPSTQTTYTFNAPSKGQVPVNSQFGQKPFGSSYTQTQFGSANRFGSQFVQQPLSTQGSGQSSGSTSQTQTAFGQKPITSQTGYGFQQNAFGASTASQFGQKAPTTYTFGTPFKTQSTQFGQQTFGSSTTGQSGNSVGQNSQTSQAAGLGTISQTSTSKPIGSLQTGSYYHQVGQAPQTNLGSSFTTTPSKGQYTQPTQFGQKPIGFSQSGTGTGYQFGVKPQTSFGTIYTTAPKVQPFSQYGIKQSSQNTFQQSQFGSTTGFKFGQKLPSNVGTVFTTSQVQPISQNEKKAFGSQPTKNTVQQSQVGSTESRFGETSGAVSQTTTSFEQKPIDESLGVNTFSTTTQAPQSGQTIQFSVKPLGSSQTSGSSYSQTQFGLSGTQYGQNAPSGVNTFSTTTQSPQFQGSQVGSTSSLLFNQQPEANKGSSFSIGTESKGQSGQATQFGSSQTLGSGISQTPFGSSFETQNSGNTQSGVGTVQVKPISQYGVKPLGSQSTQGSFSQTQYGSTVGSQSPQIGAIVPQTAISVRQNPVVVSQTTSGSKQTQLGSSSSSLFSEKAQSTQSGSFSSGPVKGQSGQSTQFGVQPLGSSQNVGSTFSQTQFGLAGAQYGQNAPSYGNTFSTTTQSPQFQGPQFGSTSSLLLNQKPETNKGSSFSIGTESKGQSGQTTQFGSSQTPSSGFSQTQFGSSFGSQNSEKTQSGVGTVSTINSQVQPISQQGVQAFGSQSTQNSFSQAQGLSTSSQLGINAQTTSTVPQTTTSVEQKPIAVSQTSSGYEQAQIGSTTTPLVNAGTVSNLGQAVQTTQYELKPFQNSGSTFTESRFGTSGAQKVENQQTAVNTVPTTTQSLQGSQFGVSTGSQSGQTQFNQKPFGSYQNTGSYFGSNFNAKPQSTFGTQSSSSVFGTQAKKTFSYTPFSSQYTFGQKPQASASAFASSLPSFGSTQTGQYSKYQNTQFGTGGSQSGNTFGGSQTAQGQTTQLSSQIGAQAQKPFGSSQFTYQQGYNKPFGSQGSAFQFGQSNPSSTISNISIQPSKEQNAFSTVSRFGEGSKILDQNTYQSTVAPLEYSTTFSSANAHESATPIGFVSSTPQNYFTNPLTSASGSVITPSGSFSTANVVSNQDSLKPGQIVSTVQNPISEVEVNNQKAGFVDFGVEFKNLPSFNAKTGYHY